MLEAVALVEQVGIAGMAHNSPDYLHSIAECVNLAMADPKIKERIASLGGVALPGSPEDYGRTIAADTDKWAKVVQFSGAHVN